MVRDRDYYPDLSRRERPGFDEIVFCAGNSADQVRRTLQGAAETGILFG
jgi:NCAIR mutase (PurE)-related protein